MPKVMCEAIIHFLEIKHLVDDEISGQEHSDKSSFGNKTEQVVGFDVDNAFTIASALESELIRSEQCQKVLLHELSMSSSNVNDVHPSIETAREVMENSNSPFYSMQYSLMKAMGERDEAHSQLIGASKYFVI